MAEGTLARLQRRAERERERREEAERIAETSTRDLYERQRELEELAAELEDRVRQRTEELERRLAQQAELAEVSSLALEGLSLDEFVDEVSEATARALDLDRCDVFALTDDGQRLLLRAGVGWPPEAIGKTAIDVTPDGQTGVTLQRRDPLVVADRRRDGRFTGGDSLDEAGASSITVVVPGPEDPWGVFGVHAGEPRAFDEDDAAFVRSMAHVLGQTIHRSRSRRKLEAYATRLERANEDLHHFAHVAGHDLREPVRTVNAYLDLLVERHADRLPEDGRELVDEAQAGARRIDEMVDGLLRYARVDADGAQTQPVDADEVLDDVLASLSVKIEETGARIDREPLPAVEADPAQLGQLFQNLVANALAFAEPGEPPKVRIGADREGPRWRLWVADEGVGMDPAETEDVFQIFHQGSDDGGTGQGIGLAVCQRIVERHGGRIEVDTAPGEGSTFHVTLPAADAEAHP